MANIGELYESKRSSSPYTIQLVARDSTQLNSDVIAVWKHSAEDLDISRTTPDIFLHTNVLAGEGLGYWKKVAKQEPVDFSLATFKQADIDYLADDVEEEHEAKRWHTWKVNKGWVDVKRNLYSDDKFYPGEVYPPLAIDYFIQHNAWPTEKYIESLKPGIDY